jgi:phage protein D
MPQSATSPLALPRVASILVAGSALPEAAMFDLVEVRVEQAIRVASRAVLRFSDEQFELIDSSQFEVDKDVVVKFSNAAGVLTEVFKGQITSISIEQSMAARHELVIEAFDKTHRLSHASKPKTYLKQSYAGVIRQIAQEVGLSATVDSSLNKVTHEYLICTGTYAGFLDQIALLTGTEWLIDGNMLRVRPRPAKSAAMTLKFGEDLVRFKARFTGSGRVKEVQVRSWDPASKQPIVGTTTVGASGVNGMNETSGSQALRTKAAGVAGVMINGNLAAHTTDEANSVAVALNERRSTTDLNAKGEVLGSPELKAGTYVSIQGVGTRMAGTYYLTAVDHIFGRGGDLVTRFTAGPIENTSIVDLLGDQTGALGDWASNGPVIGLVTNNKDPDGLHRVKVKFPTLSMQDESNWARIVTLGAGANRGLQMLPQVNDEVLVVFEHGDLRRPLILGNLWNGRDKPPAPATSALVGSDGKVKEWGLTSNSGHTLAFRDGPDDFNVEVKHKDGGTKLLLDKEKVELHAKGQTLEVKCGEASIKLESNGNVTIKGAQITVDATTSIDLKSKTTLNAKANASAKVEGATVEIKSSGPLQAQASGPLILKGNPAMIN